MTGGRDSPAPAANAVPGTRAFQLHVHGPTDPSPSEAASLTSLRARGQEHTLAQWLKCFCLFLSDQLGASKLDLAERLTLFSGLFLQQSHPLAFDSAPLRRADEEGSQCHSAALCNSFGWGAVQQQLPLRKPSRNESPRSSPDRPHTPPGRGTGTPHGCHRRRDRARQGAGELRGAQTTNPEQR